MKVILLQDVAKIGRRFSVVEVPDGYALNQLIPKKMAQPATPENLKKVEKRQADTVAGKEADRERFDVAVQALAANPLKIKVDANEQGHLFQAVRETDIAASATEQGIVVDVAVIKIPTQIKSVGEHAIDLHMDGKKKTVTIEVLSK